MPGRIEFEFPLGDRRGRPATEADRSLRIILAADLSGRASRGIREGLHGRSAPRIDVDRFDAVFSRLAPAVSLDLAASGPTTVRFREFEDLHPDRLVSEAAPLRALFDLRRRLRDPATAAAALAEMGASPPAAGAEAAEDDVARLLGRPKGAARPTTSRAVRDLVAEATAGATAPDVSAAVAAVDALLGEGLRRVLRAPSFRELEAAWLGVRMLASRLEIGAGLDLRVLDVSAAELDDDLEAGGDGLAAVLRGVADPERPGALLLALDRTFDASPAAIAKLSKLAAVAAAAGAAAIAGADRRMLGDGPPETAPDPSSWRPPEADAGARWLALRRTPAARSVGLALCRILMRVPYGLRTDPIESFPFEEVAGAPSHGDLVWGGPAFACVLAAGSGEAEIEDVPTWAWPDPDGDRVVPCCEARMTERAVDVAIAAGLSPLVSRAGSNAIRVVRIQAIADPPVALPGIE